MLNAFINALTFTTIIPFPSRLIPEWNKKNLRFFCLMLPVVGLLLSLLWLAFWKILSRLPFSANLKGFMMTLLTLMLTGGLHLDGLMDTCDALFSHRDRETRLKILSDTHSGSFAVMGCVIIIVMKTLLFAELKNFSPLIPALSRLGMGLLLCNMPFAKNDGLAVTLGSSRNRRDNSAFAVIFMTLSFMAGLCVSTVFAFCLAMHVIICVKIFGGITGDLLGAFVEISEVLMLLGKVIELCIL